MKVAAYQAPLESLRLDTSLTLIRQQVDRCERLGVDILCCPEGALGGLADYADRPADIAIDADGLRSVAAALASDRVTTIIGFTEVDLTHRLLFNSAAVLARGSVIGVYRKRHPAINRSVYHAGAGAPVFTASGLTFGIAICRDTLFDEPIATMAARGAAAVFVPANNGMPPARGGAELVAEARATDIAQATRYRVPVVRADVAGRAANLVSYGSSGIVAADGTVLAEARQLQPDLVVAAIG